VWHIQINETEIAMTNVKSDERRLEILEARHFRADDRYHDKMELGYAKVERAGLIGELVRDGRAIYYINLSNRDGNLTGKTKESVSYHELAQYLIRNHYV
jgi:hypothetical protein